MALSFTRLSWLWFGSKEKDKVFSSPVNNAIKSASERGVGSRGEPESLRFNSIKGVDKRRPSSSSNRKVRRKWKSREERRIDKEYDVVLVPSDGVCLSGSESDASDWSIGWLEPHGSEFQTDEETDDSFAVLVPCYRYDSEEARGTGEVEHTHGFWNAAKKHPAGYSDGSNDLHRWLSSFQKLQDTTFL